MMKINAAVQAVLESRYATLMESFHDYVIGMETAFSEDSLRSLDVDFVNIASVYKVLLLNQTVSQLTYLYMVNLLVRLDRYMSTRGYWQEKLKWSTGLLGGETDSLHHVLLNLIGTAYSESGDHQQAIEFYRRAIATSGYEENAPELTRIYGNLGVAYWSIGQLDLALKYMRNLLRVKQETKNSHEVAVALANLAQIQLQLGDTEGSLMPAYQALQMAVAMGDSVLQAQFLGLIATLMFANQLAEKAVPVFEMAIQMSNAVNDEIGLALTYLNYGVLRLSLGQPGRAAQMAQAALSRFEQVGMEEESMKAAKLLQDAHYRMLVPPIVESVLEVRYRDLCLSLHEFVNNLNPQLQMPHAAAVLRLLDTEFENFAALFNELQQHSDAALLKPAMELYLALGNYLDIRALHEERRRWGWMLVEQAEGPLLPDDLAALLTNDTAEQTRQQILAQERITDEERDAVYELAEQYNALGIALWHKGEAQEAVNAFQKAHPLYQKIAAYTGEVGVLLNITNVLYSVGQYDDEIPVMQLALEAAADANDPSLKAGALYHFANALAETGQPSEAESRFQQALALYQELEDEAERASVLFSYAQYLAKQERLHEGLSLGAQSLAIMEKLNLPDAAFVRAWIESNG